MAIKDGWGAHPGMNTDVQAYFVNGTLRGEVFRAPSGKWVAWVDGQQWGRYTLEATARHAVETATKRKEG